jgi:hypothetical protein
MKKTVLMSIKVLLTTFLLYNIGFFSLFSNIENNPSPPIKADRGRADHEYLSKKVVHAQEMGKTYGPEEYFADLTEIRLKEKQNDFDRRTIIHVNSSITQLLAVFDKNIKLAYHNLSKENYAILMSRLSTARAASKEIIDPGSTQRALEAKMLCNNPGYWSGILLSILGWLFSFYLKNLPLALVLLWTWWYQEKESLRISNPLSFLICLTIYPLVIGRVWIKTIREDTRFLRMKIEFRRRQVSLFSIISKDELSEMRNLSKRSWEIRIYQQKLDIRELVIRHAFLPALAVTIILMIMPSQISYAHNNINQINLENVITAPPGLNYQYLQVDHLDNTTWSPQFITEELVMKIPYFSVIRKIVTTTTSKLLTGYKRKLEAIPILTTN